MTVYKCSYKFENKDLLFIKETIISSIMDIQEGFWVNEDFEYTKASDNVYWIPPSRILFVKKESA